MLGAATLFVPFETSAEGDILAFSGYEIVGCEGKFAAGLKIE